MVEITIYISIYSRYAPNRVIRNHLKRTIDSITVLNGIIGFISGYTDPKQNFAGTSRVKTVGKGDALSGSK